MNPNERYLEENKNSWNTWADSNFQSDFYQMDAFRKGASSLKSIEAELLGDVEGKTILHLQCHFGQDSISLARMGAKVTALDLSDRAITLARQLNDELGTDVNFVQGDVYSAPELIKEQFDIVFTSWGTIGWLPDIQKWADVVAKMMKPGGRLVFAEFHPVIWMFDDNQNEIIYDYLNGAAIEEEVVGNYAEKDKEIRGTIISWNHGLSEVIQALLSSNLTLTSFSEFAYSPYEIFKEMEEFEPGKFRLKKYGSKLPMCYALTATKS